MAAIVVVLSIVTRLWGERIGINRGQGWDGETYVQWAADFPHQMFDIGTTTYHAQRVLPSAVLYSALKAVGARPTVENILVGFHILDTLMLVLAAILWARIAEDMKWRPSSIWVGFVALFASFANARHALYYPALTDSAAFALGMAMTWGYLARRPIVLWLCAGIGMVTWPGLPPIAIAMLLVPRLGTRSNDPASDEGLAEPAARWRWWIRGGAAAMALAATAAFLVLAFHYLHHPVQALGIPKFATWVRRDLLPITTITLALAMAATWFVIVYQPRLWNVRAWLRTIRGRRTALAIAAIAALLVARKAWLAAVVTKGPGPTGEQFLCLQTLEALRGPLWGIVHHVVYMGPIVAIAIVSWRAVCRVVGSWGHAAGLAFAILVVFLAGSESRQWIHLFPLFVAATIAATDARWTPRRAIVFTAVALAWSKLWLHIGYDTPGNWQTFPTQRYFMHLGPWASDTAYAWHGIAAIVTAIGLWLVLRERRAG